MEKPAEEAPQKWDKLILPVQREKQSQGWQNACLGTRENFQEQV